MPKVHSGEGRKHYVNRAVEVIMDEDGSSPRQAAGKAHGMYDQYLKNKRKRARKKGKGK